MVAADSRERIIAVVQVDHLFKDYVVELEPQEALSFVEVAPLAGAPSAAQVGAMINGINALIPPIDFGPTNPQTGKPHHKFVVGRERGHRIIKVTLFTGFFPLEYEYTELLKQIHLVCRDAGARMEVRYDTNAYPVVIHWAEETEASNG